MAAHELAQRLRGARTILITNHEGVDACSLDILRRRLRQDGACYQVVKNTVARLAVKKVGPAILDEFLRGPSAFAFTDEEPGQLSKMLLDFGREQERFTIRGGIFQDGVLKREEIELWAMLPERSKVFSLFVAALKMPQLRLAMALGGIIKKLICVVELVKKGKESE